MFDTDLKRQWKVVTVKPERLRSGLWGYKEGDISLSYSADTYGEHKKLRKAFDYQHGKYVAMGFDSRHFSKEAKAYPLIHKSYLEQIQAELDSSGLTDFYATKEVKFYGNDCVLGCPVIFKQRELTEDELIEYIRRQFAYGGLFAKEAGSYANLLKKWLSDYQDLPKIRIVLEKELRNSLVPQTQSEMVDFVENMKPSSGQLDLF